MHLPEITFVKPLEGINIAPDLIRKLNRALYGLKESPALYQKHFCQTLTGLGLEAVPDAPYLYANSHHLFVFFFVDDVILSFHARDEAFANAFQEDLFKRYGK